MVKTCGLTRQSVDVYECRTGLRLDEKLPHGRNVDHEAAVRRPAELPEELEEEGPPERTGCPGARRRVPVDRGHHRRLHAEVEEDAADHDLRELIVNSKVLKYLRVYLIKF